MTPDDEITNGNITDDGVSIEEKQIKVSSEIDDLIREIKKQSVEYPPSSYSRKRLAKLIRKNFDRFSINLEMGLSERLKTSVGGDLLDLDTWKGAWYMMNYTLEYQSDLLKRRLSGDYETDEWGYDPEVLQFVKPFFDFVYKSLWRVETTGIENIPNEGRALLVCNDSRYLSWNGVMIATAIYNEHPNQRLVRSLYPSWYPTIPFISNFLVKLGQVLVNEENCVRLLEQEELVVVFPERYRSGGKFIKDNYQKSNLGYKEFVQMAIRIQAPIIPVSIIGVEETEGIPMPSKCILEFGKAIGFEEFSIGQVDTSDIVNEISEKVQNVITDMYSQG